MNRIEKILEEVERKIAKYPDDVLWMDRYKKQGEFFKWLLEDSEEIPLYELHQPRVKPSVWGFGDVSYHIDIQLQKIKTPAMPVVLIFDYKSLLRKED